MQRRLQSRFGMHIPDANTVLMMSAKPVSYIPQSARLLDQLCEILRYKHYSLRTEEACLYWVNRPGAVQGEVFRALAWA